ncbi:MAG TPA: anaerobic carbon-monoxide dehydrogenase catalytic subunit [Crocinitomix sp.]|nr:anaerobic carbon-monoxide dehydrogenase catalytic subunit [Crocinitomix sp.]
MLENYKSVDPTVSSMIFKAEKENIETVWDRHDAMQPQCGFGETGACCRICWKGPCRVDPLGNGPKVGICGANIDVIVARNLLRSFAVGTSAHTEHARHIAHTLLEVSQGKADAYKVKDKKKLIDVAKRLNLNVENKDTLQIAKEVATTSLEDFGRLDGEYAWANAVLTEKRKEKMKNLGLMPKNLGGTVVDCLSRTHVGSESDPANLLASGARLAIADVAMMAMGTELSDILFGTPTPVMTTSNMAVLKKDAINIALHGHNPLLCEVVCDAASLLNQKAKDAGAKEGINIVGVCCTGNELMERHGVPLATNYLTQELLMVTGAVEAMVVDTQCIMPAIVETASHYHTRIISTLDENKIGGATHVSFHPQTAMQSANKIIELAIEAYANRDDSKVEIPNGAQKAMSGFSYEAIISTLALLNADDPISVLTDNIANGNIQGIVLFGGCNNTKVVHNYNYITMAKELAKKNILVVATGCAVGALATGGLMTQEATLEYAGDTLKEVLTALGDAAGLKGPLPMVLNMGSCVDNTRVVRVCEDAANKLGVDIDKLPIAISAPELMSEKAQIIGTWGVVIGLPTHVGVIPPVTASSFVTNFLTEGAKDLFGGHFIVEPDPLEAVEKINASIQSRRIALGI